MMDDKRNKLQKYILLKIKNIEKRKCVLFHFRVSAWTVWLFILCSLIVIDIYDLHRFQMQKTLFQIINKNVSEGKRTKLCSEYFTTHPVCYSIFKEMSKSLF
jgi:hypothetical protein